MQKNLIPLQKLTLDRPKGFDRSTADENQIIHEGNTKIIKYILLLTYMCVKQRVQLRRIDIDI